MFGKTAELNCSKCRKRVPVSEMKYSKDGSLICEQCTGKVAAKPAIKVPEMPKPKVQQRTGGKVTYVCKGCNYKFTRAIDYYSLGQKVCPFCGRETIMHDLPNDANELLKELDKMDDV